MRSSETLIFLYKGYKRSGEQRVNRKISAFEKKNYTCQSPLTSQNSFVVLAKWNFSVLTAVNYAVLVAF